MLIARLLLVLTLALSLNAEAQSRRPKKKPAATKRVPGPKKPKPSGLKPAEPLTAEPTPAPAPVPAEPAVAQPEPPPAAPVEATVKAEPTPAPAGTVVLAVPRTPTAQDASTSLQGELTRLLSGKPGVQVVDVGAAFPAPAPASLQEADRLYDEGKTLYDNLDPEAAAAKFIAATEAYEKHPAELKPERLAKAFIFLGACQLLNGDKDGAKVSFLRALAANPGAQPDPNLFGSDVQAAFTDTSQEFLKQASGMLVVDSKPQGARVTVRGEDVGVTPLKNVPVHAGRHPVVITLPGYTPYASYPQVAPGKTAELKPQLEPLPGLAAVLDSASKASTERAFDASIMPPEVGAIGDRLSARYVVLAAVTEKKGRVEAELQAWDVQTRSRLRGVEIDPRSRDPEESIAGAADRVHAFIQGGPLSQPSSSPAMAQVVKKPWFWAAVVGGAAVVTGGIVYATQADKRPGGILSGVPGIGF